MIERSYKIDQGQLNNLAGIKLDKRSFGFLAVQELCRDLKKGEKPPKYITVGFAMDKYPLVKDKVSEIKKSIERGEMTRRILADKDCVLKKKPVSWAKLTAMFYDDLTGLISELTRKHNFLKSENYIIFKDKKLMYNPHK